MTNVQGSASNVGVATFLDVDGGLGDSFAASPPDTACVGRRGQDEWQDCSEYHGSAIGVNR